MPTIFNLPNPETGKFEPVEHFYITEVARILHSNRDWVREQCRLGQFPHVEVGDRYYMTAAHIARAYDVMTYAAEPPPVELPPPPTRLGTVVDPDDIEGVR